MIVKQNISLLFVFLGPLLQSFFIYFIYLFLAIFYFQTLSDIVVIGMVDINMVTINTVDMDWWTWT